MIDIILSGIVSLFIGYIIPQPKWARDIQEKLRVKFGELLKKFFKF